ncbi:MAG: alcohol dehydrogenase catalytic domain-containing protein, partial [Limisphaerales bacterium]
MPTTASPRFPADKPAEARYNTRIKHDQFKIPKQMQAVVYRGRDDLRVETVPVPKIEGGELLVKVAVCGVCPTDIKKIHYGTVPPPRIFGHETSGTVVQVGRGVTKFRVGDRVGLHHHVPCLDCHYCRHHAFAQCAGYKRTGITAGFEPAGGGYAEYVRVMPFVLPGVVKIPSRNTFLEGAMLEPVNTVLKGIKRLNILPDDNVCVMGQGPIGLLFTKILSLQGINVIATDLMTTRLKLAEVWGAKKAFNAADPKLQLRIANYLKTSLRRKSFANSSNKKRHSSSSILHPLFDAAVVAVPASSAVDQAFQLVRGSGQVVLFAHTKPGDPHPVDLSNVCLHEKDLIGSYSADFLLQREVARL